MASESGTRFAVLDFRARHAVVDHFRRFLQLVPVLAKCLGSTRQQRAQSALPVMIIRREIGAAEKRFAFRGEKQRQRPSALPGEKLHRELIARVDIQQFIAIHLDGDI